jgi:hypothetical protein
MKGKETVEILIITTWPDKTEKKGRLVLLISISGSDVMVIITNKCGSVYVCVCMQQISTRMFVIFIKITVLMWNFQCFV